MAGLRVVRQAPPVGAASFSASYVGPAGWGFDPVGEEGVARIVNHLVTVAAGRYDRVALARRLDRAGATLSSHDSPETVQVTIWGPVEDWESLLSLLAQVVLEPRFDPDDLARVRRQMFERQLRERTQPGSRAELELLRAVFPKGHPYRATGFGGRASVTSLTRSRLAQFHREHYTSGGASVVLTTPAPLRTVERAVREQLGAFPIRTGPRLRMPRMTTVRPKEIQVDLPGRVAGRSAPRGPLRRPVFPDTRRRSSRTRRSAVGPCLPGSSSGSANRTGSPTTPRATSKRCGWGESGRREQAPERTDGAGSCRCSNRR